MNSFMSWVGGKKALRDSILARLPPYYERYIEVFGGAGWVLFRKPPGRDFEVYNDFNSNLVNLYRCVRDKPNKLKYKLRYVLNSREDFDWIAMLHKRKLFPRLRDVDRAAKFYQMIRYSYASGLDLVSKLHTQLSESKGKKVYGYLKPDVKKIVDEIFARLADNESVKKMYSLWCEMEQQKHDVYSSAKVDFPLLVDNKEFKSVKNMIVQTVTQMNLQSPEIEVEMPEPDLDIPLPIDEEAINETVDNSVENSTQNELYIKWSDSYKEAHKLILSNESTLDDYKKAKKLLLSESNNVLALYDLGKLYSMENFDLKDDEKSFEFYEKALQGFIQIEPKAKKIKSYLQYQIGMMYFQGLGNPVDNQKAAKCFEKSAELGNKYARRLLAFEYTSGKNLKQNIENGIPLLTEFADSGDAFSCYKLGTLYLKGEIVNQDLDKAEKYLLSAEDNEFTQYALGKLYMQKEKYSIEKAISYFEKSADKNMWASYQLGRLYIFVADDLKKDKEKAIQFFNLSAEQGNEYAQNILDNQEKFENEMLASTIFSLFVNFSRCIEDDYHRKFQSGRKMIDSKLRKMIQEKNQALGIKQEHGQTQEY